MGQVVTPKTIHDGQQGAQPAGGVAMAASRAARAVEGLLRRIEALAGKTLQALRLDPPLKDVILRQVASHRSKGLLDSLAALAAFLESHSSTSLSSGPGLPLRRLAVSKTDSSGGGLALISLDEVLYAASGAAFQSGIVKSSWSRSRLPAVRPDRVYVRTAREVYLTHYRSLAELRRRLDTQQFVSIHQSVLVNLQKLAEIDFSGRSKQVGVTIADGSRERLVVSRRLLPMLRTELGLPPRQRKASR